MAKLTRGEVIAKIKAGESLMGDDLSRLDLHWANLSKTDLGDANLNNVDLGDANLSEAYGAEIEQVRDPRLGQS